MHSLASLTSTTAVGLLICVLFIFGAPITARAFQDAETATMQCMEKCVRTEGLSKKETCKSRCASLPAIFGSEHKKLDCMQVFKNCYKSCPKRDKRCEKVCKQSLMQCS